MAKQLKFTFKDKEYVLEFTRRTVTEMEKKGFGDDLRRLVLSLPDQTVGFGTAFLQPLVVELFGQLLKFVFHSVI